MKNVHTEHCCVIHGCKYGEEDCPVATGKQKQSYLCENCGDFETASDTIAQWQVINDRIAQLKTKERNSVLDSIIIETEE
jgi:hypothetical protein